MTRVALLLSLLLVTSLQTNAKDLPDTGVSGVYEVIVGVDEAASSVAYFAEFGFRVVAEASLSAAEANLLYGVDSGASVFRLQNGDVDAHGLLRIIEWDSPLGPGVGFAPPETVGVRMAVMRTQDIVRLADIFSDLREKSGKPYLLAGPVYDDLYNATEGNPTIKNRRVGVREMGVYGQDFNHVFFQRYGYTIPGYGTITDNSPLRTSEFTHHDFFVSGNLDEVTAYYSDVLGFKSEGVTVIDGEWQPGPKAVFQMGPGRSHWYRGFVSPNNICGKLKFFSVEGLHQVDDRSHRQRPGELGITLHSVWTPKLSMIHDLARAEDIEVTEIRENEFGEQSFLISGPDGATWQVIGRDKAKKPATVEFDLVPVAH